MDLFHRLPVAMISYLEGKLIFNKKAQLILEKTGVTEDEFLSKISFIEKSGYEITKEDGVYIIKEYHIENIFNKIGHELRTPLTGILTAVESIKSEYNKTKLDEIENETFRLYEMIEKIMCAMAAKKDELILLNTYFKSSELIEEIEKDIEIIAKDYVGKKVKIEKTDEFTILADRKKIVFSIVELVQNSLRYMGDFGIVKIKVTKKEQMVEISVKDTGYGVSESVLKNLGTLYYKENFGEDGIGCGLYCVKKIAEKHEGTLEIFSESGKGFEVVIKIPNSEI